MVNILFHLTFIFFWILHLLFSVGCLLGPLISSGLNPIQKNFQSVLVVLLLLGCLVPPMIYIAAVFGEKLAASNSMVRFGLLSVFIKNADFFSSPWFCLTSPGFLGFSILIVFVIKWLG